MSLDGPEDFCGIGVFSHCNDTYSPKNAMHHRLLRKANGRNWLMSSMAGQPSRCLAGQIQTHWLKTGRLTKLANRVWISE
jgi:hypothetical protein